MADQSEIVRVVIEWENKRISIEGPSGFVEAQTRFFARNENKPLDIVGEHKAMTSDTAADLISQKRPKGHHEVVAVLAFYLAEQGTAEFSDEDIKRVYIQARVRPPKVLGQALRDAKNKFDYLEATKTRGCYRLSPHGDRTVRFDLPRDAI